VQRSKAHKKIKEIIEQEDILGVAAVLRALNCMREIRDALSLRLCIGVATMSGINTQRKEECDLVCWEHFEKAKTLNREFK